MELTVIKTNNPNLQLVEMKIEDAERVYPVVEQNREYLAKFFGWARPQTLESHREFYQSVQLEADFGLQRLFIIESNGEAIGNIGLNSINPLNDKGEIGYWLAEKYSSKGLMTACVQALEEYAFDVLELNSLEIKARPDNIASNRIAIKLDYHFDGILRAHEKLNEKYYDIHVYSKLRGEWESE